MFLSLESDPVRNGNIDEYGNINKDKGEIEMCGSRMKLVIIVVLFVP